MAVAVQLDFAGVSLEQYDQVCKLMGLTPKGPGPAGSISHFATMTDSGLRVVDVWESKEQFDTFAQEQIGPLSQQAGFAGPPEIQVFDVHNYFTPGG
jgi:hypothetical protein